MAADTGDDGIEMNHNTVFIDTSIDTHIATIVSDTDTVSDLKKKITVEHQQCFPAIGEIKVHCLKVKRRGNLYHLSDSMLVKSAFGEAKGNWFVLVDASPLEKRGEIEQNAGDDLALPWVAVDGPSKLSLDRGSPLIQPKIVPFVNELPSGNQSTSGDSCKDLSPMEKNKAFNEEKALDLLQENCDVNVETSKKRTREDALEFELFSKKKRKSEGIEDPINHENSDENSPKSQSLTLNDEHIKTMLVSGKKIKQRKDNSALDQLTTSVPSVGGDHLEEEILGQKNTEAMPDVAMVLEKSIQQGTPLEISQNKKCNELVEKMVLENEIPSSPMRTSGHEHDAPEVATMDHVKDAKHSTKQNAAEKEVSSSSTLSKKVQNINNGDLESSQQDVGSNGEKFSGDKLHKRKKTKKSAKNKDKSLVKHADNVVGDISSTLSAVAVKGTSGHEHDAPGVATMDHVKDAKHSTKQNAAEKEVSSSSTLSKKVQNINNGDLESSQQDVGSNGEKFSGDKLHKRKKTKKSAKNKDQSLVKHADNVVGDISSTLSAVAVAVEGNIIDEQKNGENILPHSEKKEILEKTSINALENEVETPKHTETNISQINEEGIEDKLIKENVKINVKTKKKKKTKKSAIGDGQLHDNVEKDKGSEKETRDISKEKLADASQVEGGKVERKESEFETNASVEDDVDGKSRKSTSKRLSFVQIEEKTNEVENLQLNKLEKTQDAQSVDEEIVKKPKKSHKSSRKGRQDSQRKHQITEEPSNNMLSSEVPKDNVEKRNDGNNKVDILKDGSHDIDFRHYFGPGQQPNEVAPVDNVKDASKKQKKKTEELPLTSELSTDVVKDQSLPNIAHLKTPIKTKKIDAPRTSPSSEVIKKQQSTVRQSQTPVSDRVTRSRKSAEVAKSSQDQKSLMLTSKEIFENGSDESSADDNATINSNTSTHTPSDESSSSGESDSSFDLRRKGPNNAIKRKEGGAKNSMNSQSRLKNVSMAELLRSSRRFKKAKLNASQVEDTESQPVDFVPESQPTDKV